MGRERVPRGKIIQKKEDIVKAVFDRTGNNSTEELFIETFKEMYPNDWDNIVKRYQAHVRVNKPGKSFPMPEPTKYLQNTAPRY